MKRAVREGYDHVQLFGEDTRVISKVRCQASLSRRGCDINSRTHEDKVLQIQYTIIVVIADHFQFKVDIRNSKNELWTILKPKPKTRKLVRSMFSNHCTRSISVFLIKAVKGKFAGLLPSRTFCKETHRQNKCRFSERKIFGDKPVIQRHCLTPQDSSHQGRGQHFLRLTPGLKHCGRR